MLLDLYLHEEVELGHIKRSSSHYLDTKTQRCSEKKEPVTNNTSLFPISFLYSNILCFTVKEKNAI